ncbi:MAG: ABC transporter permease subunit, partial [Ilumatobacteraceae bacterium]
MSDVMGPSVVTEPEAQEDVAAAQAGGGRSALIEVVTLYVICLGAALTLAAVLVSATGGSWTDVYRAMLDGSVGAPGRWGLTLGVAAPILLVGLGTIVSGRAGLVNIGQEGQVVMGAFLAAYVGSRFSGPGPINLVLMAVAGVVSGAIWAGIAGVLRY